jgi:hypothetical protein
MNIEHPTANTEHRIQLSLFAAVSKAWKIYRRFLQSLGKPGVALSNLWKTPANSKQRTANARQRRAGVRVSLCGPMTSMFAVECSLFAVRFAPAFAEGDVR